MWVLVLHSGIDKEIITKQRLGIALVTDYFNKSRDSDMLFSHSKFLIAELFHQIYDYRADYTNWNLHKELYWYLFELWWKTDDLNWVFRVDHLLLLFSQMHESIINKTIIEQFICISNCR